MSLSLPAFALREGGIDGGGGGTLPANPISIQQAQDIIQGSKKDLRLLYRSFQRHLTYDETLFEKNLIKKLFGTTPTLIDVLEKTEIEIQLDKPCYDLYSNESDGSVHAKKSNAVCISAFRIAPKLSTDRARSEILALITHELGHVLGANEQEAQDLQSVSASYLRYSGPNSASDLIQNLIRSLSEFNRDADKVWETKSSSELVLVIDNLYREINSAVRDTTMAIFTTEDEEYYEYQRARVMLANWYVLGESDRSDASAWHKKYQDVFKSGDSVSLKDIPEAYAEKSRFGDLKITKINLGWDLKNTIREVSNYVYDVNNYLMSLYLSKDLVTIPTHLP